MVRRKRYVAILCVIIGFCAGSQQAALGTGMVTLSKPADRVFEEVVDGNARPGLLDIRRTESSHALLFPLILAQPDLIASASQGVGGYILVAQETKADAPAEPQAIVQETKNVDASVEPQSVMREIRSAPRISGSKQRRRKPVMAGVPAGPQAVAQEIREPESQVVVQETKEPESQAVTQRTKEPESQAVVQGAEEIDTLDSLLAEIQKTKSADIPAEPRAEAKKSKLPASDKKVRKTHYAMAPIRWKGNLSETLSLESHTQKIHSVNDSLGGFAALTRSTSKTRGLLSTQTADITAKTYILAQYLAQLDGGVHVISRKAAFSSTNFGESGGGYGYGRADSRTNQVSGDVGLGLFPQSRFPFNLRLGAGDTRDRTEAIGANTVGEARSKSISMDQTYKPRSKLYTYHAHYENTTINHLGTLEDTTHSLWSGDYRKNTNEHKIQADVRYNDKLRDPAAGISTRVNNFNIRDNYLPSDSLLTLNSLASLYSSTERVAGSNYNTHILQADTGGSWQPEAEDIPLFMDGGVRLFKMTSKDTTTQKDIVTQSVSGNIGATYPFIIFSRGVLGRADGMVASTSSGGFQNLSTSQRGTLTYNSGTTKLWKNASYSWNANGGAANQTGYGSNTSSVFAGVGQGLSVPYASTMFGRKWQVRPQVQQSLDTVIDRVNGHSTRLINTGAVSLSPPAAILPNKHLLGESVQTSGLTSAASLRVTDVYSIGKRKTHYRTITWGIHEKSRNHFSRGGFVLDAQWGAVQSSAGNSSTSSIGGGLAFLGNTSISYNKNSVLGVRGLNYSAVFSITGQAEARVADPNSANPKFPWGLDQNLKYKVGKNEVVLRGNIYDRYGVKDVSLWLLFRAWRTIGNN